MSTKNQKNHNKNMYGGLFDKKNKSKMNLPTIIKTTKKSEGKFFKAYEDKEKVNKEYTKAYIDHLENLELLDDRINFTGMVNVFKNLILKYNLKTNKIDKGSPILFRNYNIEGDILPSTFRKEHINQQINFLMKRYFAPSDHQFIRYMEIDTITTTSFSLNITTIDNKKYKNKIGHEGFIINKNDIKQALKDIIHTTKKNLRRDSGIIDYNNKADTKSTSSRKSISVKSSRKKRNTSTKKHNAHTIRKSQGKDQGKDQEQAPINLLPEANSKLGISKLNSKLKSIFKSQKKYKYSFDKSRRQIDKEKKEKDEKEKLEREEREKKARMNQYQESPEGIIAKKCLQYQDQPTCVADTDCFYSANINKCLRNTRGPVGPAVPGLAIGPPIAALSGLDADLINIPELEDSDDEQKL